MQRLYPMFPAGAPGLGLLMLCLSLTGGVLLSTHGDAAIVPVWIAIIPAVLMALGLVTPFAALGTACLGILHLVVSSAARDFWFAIFAANAAALALLGPGAYSLDAVRLGAECW